LCEDDGEWNQALEEAGLMHTDSQLRSLFATILLHCHPTEPAVLWNHHKVNICDDLYARLIAYHNILDPTEAQVYDLDLYLIKQIIIQGGHNLGHYPPMPHHEENWTIIVHSNNQLLHEQLDYDDFDLLQQVQLNKDQFNEEQHTAYDAVMDSVYNNRGKAFFLHSAGGGGKTFVCNTIAGTVHANHHVTLTVTSSAIAALLLYNGHTAHSSSKYLSLSMKLPPAE
jgi:hypothetical protein